MRSLGLASKAGVARLRVSLVLPVLFAIPLGCGPLSSGPTTTATDHPPPVARAHADFWSAVGAFDFDVADRLAATASQREYLGALVDMAEERLVDAQIKLLALQRSDDPAIAARSNALLWLVAHERPSSAIASSPSLALRTLNRALLDASSRESWTFPPHPVAQPLRWRGGVPLVAVTVHGREAAFGLDTGAWTTVLSSRLAAEAGVSSSPVRFTIQDTHGATLPAQLTAVDVNIGGVRVEGHRAAVLDARMLEFSTGSTSSIEFDGLLGWNAIRGLRITLDNDQRVLLIDAPRPRVSSQQDFFWVGKPFVRARAGNGFPLALFLDTAATRSYIVPTLAGAAGLRDGREESTLIRGAAGARRIQVTLYGGANLHVGSARLPFRELVARPWREDPVFQPDGVLGGDALARGRVVIDFQGREFSISGMRGQRND